jgi:hypothetical protein
MSETSPNILSLLPRGRLMAALDNECRWQILRTLIAGEPIGATELGQIVGCTSASASKHCQILIAAGICIRGRGFLYRITPRFQPAPGTPRVLDFGHCLVRFDADQAPAP